MFYGPNSYLNIKRNGVVFYDINNVLNMWMYMFVVDFSFTRLSDSRYLLAIKGRVWLTKASRTRSSVWKVGDKHPGKLSFPVIISSFNLFPSII